LVVCNRTKSDKLCSYCWQISDIIKTNLAVVFTKKDDEFYVVTAYPVKNVDKEIKSKEGKRWIRV
jgi:hypothetical protein